MPKSGGKKIYEVALARAQLEALKVRMNPHFISNALTSIRSMLYQDKKEEAIEYLTYFAKLIRKTLENATKEFITLATEIEYLTNYLEIEKLRFADKFETKIIVPVNVNAADILIPPTILQPYIENAINHGLMHRLTGGKLTISFEISENLLKCLIEDNGVGRKRASEFELRSLSSHNSLSEQITLERISLFNKVFQTEDFAITTTDLYDDHGTPAGTRVHVQLPLQNIYQL